MAEVVHIFGEAVAQALDPNDHVILCLERALGRARSGQTIAMVLVELDRDESVGDLVVGTFTSPYRVIGALEAVKANLLKDMA